MDGNVQEMAEAALSETRENGATAGKDGETAEGDRDRKKTKEERKEEFRPPPLPEPLRTWKKLLKEIWIGDEEKAVKVGVGSVFLLNNAFACLKKTV